MSVTEYPYPSAGLIRAALSQGMNAFYPDSCTMLGTIEPGYSVRAPLRPPFTTGADEAVTNHFAYTDEQAGIVVEDSDRIDPDVMEHTRQSRLRAWQEQR